MESMAFDQGKKIIILLSLLLAVALLRPHLQRYDSVGYYSWVRSLVINGNVNIQDELQIYDMNTFIIKTPTGNPAQPWPVGCSILWVPFFIMAHIFVLIVNFLGWPIIADGFSLPYRLAVACGTVIYGTLGVLIIYHIIENYFSSMVATISVITIWLASPLVFYMFAHPMMSHANDMFAYTLVLWAWLATRKTPFHPLPYALLGLASGLAALVRNQNAALAMLVMLLIGYQSLRGTLTWRQGGLSTVIFSVFWCFAFFPQLLIWKSTFGDWILLSHPYSYIPGAGTFHFGFPWIFHVMFSDNRGIFIWHPVLLLAVFGFIYLFKKDKLLFFFLVMSFLIQLGIIGSWEHWHGSRGFGQRFFVNLVPAFMLGFAALLSELQQKISIKIIIPLCLAFIVWNFLLMLQFILNTVPRGGPIDLKLMVKNQFLVVPENLGKLLRAFLTRSE
jgi:hypothetical protein